MNIGHNTVSGQKLAGYVERLESIRAQKKQMSQQESAVLAEAKADGFLPSAIGHVIKLRAMKPHARQEAEAVVDTYLHALGMAADTPLFRQVGLINVDIKSRENVIEALKAFVPEKGSITVEAGGRPVRLTRDKKGTVSVEEIVEAPARPASASQPAGAMPETPPPPDVDDLGAEQLGREAYDANAPIIANPFPFGDSRRAKWDAGWRAASGTDGMGPDD